MAAADLDTTLQRFAVEFEVTDERGNGLRGDRELVRLCTGGRWLEGPAWFPAFEQLIFSDIPNDRLLRHDEVTGHTSVLRDRAGHHNGHSVDRAGRLLSAEHGARRVTRTEPDGSLTVLADSYHGAQLNSPNDLAEAPDGSIWFTDPTYGIASDYEGYAAAPEQDGRHVYRIDPDGTVTRVVDDFDQPNGIAFSADGRRVHISDSARRHLRSFDLVDGGVRGGAVLVECPQGAFDGLRVDTADRLWVSSGRGVEVYAPDGSHLAVLHVPETVANLTFGGPRRSDLYLTATSSLYRLRVKATGAAPG